MSAALPRAGCGALSPVAKERESLGSVIELVKGRDNVYGGTSHYVAVEIILVLSWEAGAPILVLSPTSWEPRGKWQLLRLKEEVGPNDLQVFFQYVY